LSWHEQLKQWAGTFTIIAGAALWAYSQWESLATDKEVAAAVAPITKDQGAQTKALQAMHDDVSLIKAEQAHFREVEMRPVFKVYAGEMAVRNEHRPAFRGQDCLAAVRRLAEERFEYYVSDGEPDYLKAANRAAAERIALDCR
jgi:hypothetical protein